MKLAYDMVSRPQATTNAGPSLKVNQNLMKQGADDVRVLGNFQAGHYFTEQKSSTKFKKNAFVLRSWPLNL